MTQLRKELKTATLTDGPCMSNGTAYLMIFNAVKTQNGLVHGKLHADGEHCAIGSYFDINKRTTLPESLIDEVAAVNDSMPKSTPRQRKLAVLRWLRWKLSALGMPGFDYQRAANPKPTPR